MTGARTMIIQIIIFLFTIECDSPNTDNNHINNKSLGEILRSDTIDLSALSKKNGDSIIANYYLYNKLPYSGKAVEFEMADDGKWSFVYSFKNGIMQRLDVYGINGYQHRFVEMKNGKEYHTIMFHRNGNRYLETFYDEDRRPIGLWKRWYESGELEWERSYK